MKGFEFKIVAIDGPNVFPNFKTKETATKFF